MSRLRLLGVCFAMVTWMSSASVAQTPAAPVRSTDDKAAIEAYRKVAPTSSSGSSSNHPILCVDDDPKKNAQLAKALLDRAAAAGDSLALLQLAFAYQRGSGGYPRDEAKSLQLFDKSANAGSYFALLYLERLYMSGSATVAADFNKARRYHQLPVVDRPPVANPGETAARIAEWRGAAEAGDVAAMYNLGEFYFKGPAGTRNPDEASRWLRLAAAKGLPAAQLEVASSARDNASVQRLLSESRAKRPIGLGAKADPRALTGCEWRPSKVGPEPNDLYCRVEQGWLLYPMSDGFMTPCTIPTARAGDGVAMGYVAFSLRTAPLGVRDDVAAAEWFQKCAVLGEASCERELGYSYRTGSGVQQNLVEARRLYRAAAEQGDQGAARALITLLASADPQVHDPAEAARWRKRFPEDENFIGTIGGPTLN